MANFPGSKKTWTPIADGTDYLQAAHVNEARDEITAIEEGYLEGSARLNSSGSTVATLSVTGGSTFAGNVRINGGLQSSASTVLSLVVSNNVDIGGSKITISSAGLVTQALQTTGAVALTWNDSSGGAIAALKRYEDTKMAFTGNVDFSQSTVTGLSLTLLSVGSTAFSGDSTGFVLPSTATFIELRPTANSTIRGLSTRAVGSVIYLSNWDGTNQIQLSHNDAGVANVQSKMMLPNAGAVTIRPFGTMGFMQNSSYWICLTQT